MAHHPCSFSHSEIWLRTSFSLWNFNSDGFSSKTITSHLSISRSSRFFKIFYGPLLPCQCSSLWRDILLIENLIFCKTIDCLSHWICDQNCFGFRLRCCVGMIWLSIGNSFCRCNSKTGTKMSCISWAWSQLEAICNPKQ